MPQRVLGISKRGKMVFGAIGAGLVFVGGILGVLGASTLFWTKETEAETLREMKDPQGDNVGERAEARSRAFGKYGDIQLKKDRLSLLGWGAVIVGSAFLFLSELFPDS